MLQIIIGTVLFIVLNTPKAFSDGLHDDYGSQYILVDLYSKLGEQPPSPCPKLQSRDRVCTEKSEIDNDTLEIILDVWSGKDNLARSDIEEKANQILSDTRDYMDCPVSYDPQTAV